MKLTDLRITWMDDVTEVYPNATASVSGGVLHVHEYAEPGNMLAGEWHFPIMNIRVYGPDTANGHTYKDRL